jgi:hypothetical protein
LLTELGGVMTDPLYVATDADGVEHTTDGDIAWQLPSTGATTTARADHPLVLRDPAALLGVLEEAIHRAEPVGETAPSGDGTVHATAARLVSETGWGTGSATRFALSCADHVLGDARGVPLPDGTPLGKVVSDAQRVLDGIEPRPGGDLGYLGYVARLSALRRLHRERGELSDLASAAMVADEAKDVEALDDPAYATVVPIVDAVLAAIEALRHHVLPRSEMGLEDRAEEREQQRMLEGKLEIGVPTVTVTPTGPVMSGGGPKLLAHEPAWTSAREAARHARLAARDRGGPTGEEDERSWQASALASLLEPQKGLQT